MAVPTSGILTMLGIARERKYSNYNSNFTFAYPILMYDLINGGGFNIFPSLNTSCIPFPNKSTPYSMSEWYGYDQNCAPPSECFAMDLRYVSKYRQGADACFSFPVKVYSENVGKWYLNTLYKLDCKEGLFADSGAYSDGSTWAIWDAGKGVWTQSGFCIMEQEK